MPWYVSQGECVLLVMGRGERCSCSGPIVRLRRVGESTPVSGCRLEGLDGSASVRDIR